MLRPTHGGVKVSTGAVRHSKRVEALDLYKTGKTFINAEDNFAYAA